MKISFVITYYNQEQYVKQSLDSVLAINKPCDWEIIVGDDGSTDRTVDIVRKYIEQYPDKILLNIMPRDKEVMYDSVKRASANRLSALELATGDAFCILDGDDFYCDIEFVKDAIDVLNENKNITVVAFGYRYYIDGFFGEEKILHTGVCGQVDKKEYLRIFYLPAGACVHRMCWGKDRLDYIRTIGYFDDNDIVINSLNYGEMYAFDRAIYAYRQIGTSVYTSMSEVEQALLNIQGFDVDKYLIDESYYADLVQRNAICILTAYIWKKSLREFLGTEKYDRYLSSCQSASDSLLYKLMEFKYLSKEMKRQVLVMTSELALKHLKATLKQFVSYAKYLRRSNR